MHFNYLWAKADRDGSYHPLVAHMLDVAAVSRAIFHQHASEDLQDFFICLGFEKDADAVPFLQLLIALHDIGKATPGFQQKAPWMRRRLVEKGYDFSANYHISDHSQLGQYFLPELLIDIFGLSEEIAEYFSISTTSHHGHIQPYYIEAKIGRLEEAKIWHESRRAIIELFKEIFCIETVPLEMPSASALLKLAGICSISDWIGSNVDFFPYIGNFGGDWEIYWRESLSKAQNALEQIPIHPPLTVKKEFFELFPHISQANELQVYSENFINVLDSPMLMILEAPMGTGKTEAALNAYAALTRRKAKRGFYFALPTQATGNMMFRRVEKFLQRFAPRKAELHLLHASADLNEDYRRLRAEAIYGEESDSTVEANCWFTAKKRGLWADYGVGTIDQLLMAVLKTKHFFVRLSGLDEKVVIIDEVHAYDAYMSEILEILLQWLAREKVSVILLSATLPSKKREAFIKSYAYSIEMPKDLLYPSIIGVSSTGVEVHHNLKKIGTTSASILPLPWEGEDYEPICDLLIDKLKDGGTAVCIFNTVSEAQRCFLAVQKHFPEEEMTLFHARYPLNDRLRIEKEVVEKYGKSGKRPVRGIVIATQVIEQSLDVDFDFMLTALAPIDLLFQRMGRLHRHELPRPKGVRERVLHVLVPQKLQGEKTDFGPSKWIYFPAIMYKTAKLFMQEGRWRKREMDFPCDLSRLIEKVYAENEDMQEIEQWIVEQEGREYADIFMAFQAALPPVDARRDKAELLDSIENPFSDDPNRFVAARLGAKTIEIAVLPDEWDTRIDSFEKVRAIYGRTLRVQSAWLVNCFRQRPQPEGWEKEPLLRYVKAMKESETIENNGRKAYYDPKLGLVIK